MYADKNVLKIFVYNAAQNECTPIAALVLYSACKHKLFTYQYIHSKTPTPPVTLLHWDTL